MSSLQSYHIQHLILQPDYEGEVIATLIEHPKNGNNETAVLYIHGYVDYFYQTHVADWFVNNGVDFYALELRKYGHSILEHQKPNNTRSISEYFEEITTSLRMLKEDKKYNNVILYGHSTGGLTSSLYCSLGEATHLIDGLFLNSPFLAFNLSKTLVRSIIPLVARMGRKEPDREIHAPHSDLYVKSIHKDFFGEWDFNLMWKPKSGFPIYAGWVNAIYEAHRKIDEGLNIDQPILVLHSDKSCKYATDWDESILTTDCVLNIEDIQRKSKLLGANLSIHAIPNAIHDVFLSKPEVRDVAFEQVRQWLEHTF